VIALALFAPNFIWMWQRHFPHLELLANIKRNQRNVSLSPVGFMGQQILMLHPITFPIWLAGLWHFLDGGGSRRFRTLGLAYLIALVILLATNGRTYYLLPAYPMLLAGGATALENWLSRPALMWMRPACLLL